MCHSNVEHSSYDLQPAEASVHDGAFRGEDATTSTIHQPAPTQRLLSATRRHQTAAEAQTKPTRQPANMPILVHTINLISVLRLFK